MGAQCHLTKAATQAHGSPRPERPGLLLGFCLAISSVVSRAERTACPESQAAHVFGPHDDRAAGAADPRVLVGI